MQMLFLTYIASQKNPVLQMVLLNQLSDFLPVRSFSQYIDSPFSHIQFCKNLLRGHTLHGIHTLELQASFLSCDYARIFTFPGGMWVEIISTTAACLSPSCRLGKMVPLIGEV